MTRRASGISMVEIIVAMAITVLLALMALPKTTTTQSTSTAINQADQVMEELALMMQSYQYDNGHPVNLQSMTYETPIQQYLNYFKDTQLSGGSQYFMFLDGSRLSTTPQLFAPSSPLSEYNNSGLSNTKWQGLTSNPNQYCGDFSPNECLYLDFNGASPPNQIGKGGDIIPIHLDPTTGKVQTLFEAEHDQNPTASLAQLCQYDSIYDNKMGFSAGCP